MGIRNETNATMGQGPCGIFYRAHTLDLA
jgi:hypothetical protein